MKKLLVLVLLLFVGSVAAKPQVVPFSDLHPDQQQQRLALVISRVLESFHYKQPQIGRKLSEQAFDKYLNLLDVNKMYFDQQDIDKLDRYRNELGQDLLNGQIGPAFVIFKMFRHRVDQRVRYALKLLDQDKFDFNKQESFQFDREDAPWAKNEAALDNLWRLRVKNDVLTERLSDNKHVISNLRKRYQGIRRRVEQMTPDNVFALFINAFALSIDPHTSYMSPSNSKNFDIGMSLHLQGIGAVLREHNEYTEVVSLVVGGPAARSGKLAPGDRIVGVAQGKTGKMQDVIGWRLQNVVELIRGPKGSVVRLEVLPKSEGVGGRAREITLVREEIKLKDKEAKSEILQGPQFGGMKIGVIKIPTFYRDFAAEAAGKKDFRSTTRDVRRLLLKLEKQHVNGIIIDLRENGGGSLTEAVQLTGLFIPKGPVVQVKDSTGHVDIERNTDKKVYSGPLAVLVDRNSASASEIFTGAIKDYGRGLIVGERTFGKGTVQSLLDLQRYLPQDKRAGRLRLTIAQFFRVDGSSTQLRGVNPDIKFPTAKGAEVHGERALKHALPWAEIAPAIAPHNPHFPLAMLRKKDAERIAHNPGFKFLMVQENELEKVRETKSVSLNEHKRELERKARDARLLANLNRLRAYRHLPPLKSLDEEKTDLPSDEDKDKLGIDKIWLDETARILIDLIHSEHQASQQGKTAA